MNVPDPINWSAVLGGPKPRNLVDIMANILVAAESDRDRLMALGHYSDLKGLQNETLSRAQESERLHPGLITGDITNMLHGFIDTMNAEHLPEGMEFLDDAPDVSRETSDIDPQTPSN